MRRIALTIIIASALASGQSGDFVTGGRVVTPDNQPLPGATISYTGIAKRLSWSFSDAQGGFGKSTGAGQPARPAAGGPFIHVSNGRLTVVVAGATSFTIEAFDLGGKKISTVHGGRLVAGTYSFRLPGGANGAGGAARIIKLTADGRIIHRLVLLGAASSGTAGANRSHSVAIVRTATAPAAVDTVRVGKTGYAPVKIPITEYSADVGTVTLQPVDIEGKAAAMLGQMSVAEKAGQLVDPNHINAATAASNKLGFVFGGGGDFIAYTPTTMADLADGYQNAMMGTPRKIPIIFGYDGVHGMCAVKGGTIFPHNMGIGAIQDTLLVQKAFRVTAIEIRATGANWTFAPCVAVVRDDRWGRSYEGFSESPALTRTMARHAILGLQTTDLSHPSSVAATTKHFAGDGGTEGGKNCGDTKGDDATLRSIHLSGYEAAIAAGTASLMASYSSWNGVYMHLNKELLTNWLKSQKFDGFISGDYAGHVMHGASTATAINAGVDVPMAPDMMAKTIADISAMYGSGSNARCDDAVKRVLRVKYRMDLFENYLTDRRYTPLIGCAEHRDVARECVRKSLVLLKNDNNTLPLPKTATIAIWGQHGNDIGLQCGGWTVTWQGSAGNVTPGTTIKEGFEAVLGGSSVTYSQNGGNAGSATHIVVCIGESPYAEKDWPHISLDPAPGLSTNTSLVTNAKAAGKKVIVVLITGRPLDITPVIDKCDAFVVAWIPGTEGKGVAEALFRDKPEHGFSGKLPFTWPVNLAQEPINQGDGKTGRYPFGYGLTY